MVEKKQKQVRKETEEQVSSVEEVKATAEEENETQESAEDTSDRTENLEPQRVDAEADARDETETQDSEEEVAVELPEETQAQPVGGETGVEEKDHGEAIKEESFQELYEESLKSIKEGEVVRGNIIQVTDDYVMVDIGYKSEGQIRISEFTDEEGEVTAKVGDQVDVLLEYHEDENGEIVLSKEKATKIKVWDEISKIYKDDGVIEGRIVSKVKGGLSVDIGVQAFLPADVN